MDSFTYAKYQTYYLFRQYIEGKIDYETVFVHSLITNMLDFLKFFEDKYNNGTIQYIDGQWIVSR